jgi:hypothetical protein
MTFVTAPDYANLLRFLMAGPEMAWSFRSIPQTGPIRPI